MKLVKKIFWDLVFSFLYGMISLGLVAFVKHYIDFSYTNPPLFIAYILIAIVAGKLVRMVFYILRLAGFKVL